MLVTSSVSIAIGTTVNKENTIERYKAECTSMTELMKRHIDGNQIDAYINRGENSPTYIDIENELFNIKKTMPSVKYMYVYKIEPDGCYVVFDIDTEELEGGKPGDIIPFDESFTPYLEELFEGKNMVNVISDDTYGWLLSVYNPIYDENGECAAYAAVDIDMEQIRTDNIIFVSRMASVLIGMLIVMIAYSTWYSEKGIVDPINRLVRQTRTFSDFGAYSAEIGAEKMKKYVRSSVNAVKTGDELEELYHAMCRSEDAIAGYIEEINRKSKEITTMQKNIIYSFASMVEDRDVNTGEHIRRTSEYVGIIGRRLRKDGKFSGILTDRYLEMLVQSAPLHDIGKIKISDTVLNKPGKLTDAEFEEMKTHTTVGRDILMSSLEGIEDGGYLSVAADMAQSHHEKWDGSGYPDGLSGEEIPLCARIMAVADVFDALVSKRSYKEAIPFDTAVGIIRESAGTHFDPAVAEAFLKELDSVRKVSESNHA